ncbi:hypothetical protein bcere0030_26820 [Bacillus cereus AH1273]|nr:hypothetical protein bcere0030_26820 [Bacillus cereus AH1273]
MQKLCQYRGGWVIPLFVGNKTPPQNSVKAKKLGGGRAARKSPIGEG